MRIAVLIVGLLCVAATAGAGIVSQPVQYAHEGTVFEGYLAYDDANKQRRPGVLVVHEWWGLNDYVRARVEKLAEAGYMAFALDMYGKGIWTKDPAKAKELSGHLRGTPIMRERAKAGLRILKEHPLVQPDRVAAIGYCFGGTTVLELAYSGAEVAGVVTFHGGLTSPKPEDMNSIKAKILVCHGADDGFVKPESISAFQEAMRKSKVDWQMIYYSGAVHAFTNPEADKVGIPGIAYNRSADERSWKHMETFFGELFSK